MQWRSDGVLAEEYSKHKGILSELDYGFKTFGHVATCLFVQDTHSRDGPTLDVLDLRGRPRANARNFACMVL